MLSYIVHILKLHGILSPAQMVGIKLFAVLNAINCPMFCHFASFKSHIEF